MDYELIILHTLVEIVMDEDASEHLKELRIAALNKVLRRLNAYHHLGFIRPLTTARRCQRPDKAQMMVCVQAAQHLVESGNPKLFQMFRSIFVHNNLHKGVQNNQFIVHWITPRYLISIYNGSARRLPGNKVGGAIEAPIYIKKAPTRIEKFK